MPLKEIRQREHYSIRDLAKAAGVTTQTIVNLESGARRPHPSTVRAIADVLRVDPDEIAEVTSSTSATPNPSIIPALLLQIQRLQAVAQAADRALTRLTHPTVDLDAVPPDILQVIVTEMERALDGLEDGDLQGIPAAGPVRETGEG